MDRTRRLLSLTALVLGAAASIATSELPPEARWWGEAHGPTLWTDDATTTWSVALEIAAPDTDDGDDLAERLASEVRILGEARGRGALGVQLVPVDPDADRNDRQDEPPARWIAIDGATALDLQVQPRWACEDGRCVSLVEVAFALDGAAEVDWTIDAIVGAAGVTRAADGEVLLTIAPR